MKHNIFFTTFAALSLFFLAGCSSPTGSTLETNQVQAVFPSCFTQEDGCDGGDEAYLSLELTSSNELTISRESIESGFGIQMKGRCDDGGYPDNRIEWYVVDAATSLVVGYATGNYQEKCRDGKFQFWIDVSPGYFSEKADYFLEIELIGLDDNLGEHINEVSASQTVSIRTI